MSKILFAVLAICLMSISSFAQQGINYKAIIKDDLGNVLNATFMNVQFTIHQGTTTGTIVYQENHNYTTDANGLIILNIGTDPSPNVGTFASINWSEDLHFLQTTITYNGGTINFDATEFMAVPYAKHAETAENVTGLETIEEGNGIGWRLIGQNPDNYGPIGNGAVDLSQSPNSATNGATGEYSIAMGNQTGASGDNSTAMGFGTSALGDNSTALGKNTFASSENSLAIGWLNEDVPDALFMIGNGSTEGGFTTSNALTVLKNGIITAPSFDISEITDDKALITKEYADTNLGGSGLEAIDEGNGIGWRLKGNDPNNFSNIGLNAVDLSVSNVIGGSVGATGENSVAMGLNAKASGENSIAIGRSTVASGNNSIAMGYYTTAPSYGETVMGIFSENYNPNSTTSFNPLDHLFTVGNGKVVSDFVYPSNALIILKNGTITAPSFSVGLINSAGNKALITKEYADTNFLLADGNVNVDGSLTIQNASEDTSFWRLETRPNGSLSLYRNGNYRGYFSESTGVYSSISDRRTKKNISPLDNGTLNKVMQLNPVSYLMKDQTDTKRNLGLISQEVQEIFPSIATYVEEADLITLSYTELIPILIKALQEQQNIIDGQNKTIESQTKKDIVQDKLIEALSTRLNLIESKSTN